MNLEYLSRVVFCQKLGDTWVAFPDSLVGTDSHTTMVNGLGVFGWGVGGIEAEAAMLGQPLSMLIPAVVGFKLHGRLPEGATATDLVLTVTQMLRKKGVVGKFVEFYGTGLSSLTLPDRATIANMAPEYGATMGFFPVDSETLSYLRFTARSREQVELVEVYAKEQGLFRTDLTPDPIFSDRLELDLGEVVPTMAGPKRPQDSVPLTQAKVAFEKSLTEPPKHVSVQNNGDKFDLSDGSVVIAAITSCTNTSNPSLMLGAGLLAKKAVERGLTAKPWVKTSFAPGSKVVTDYIEKAGLWPYLNSLRFNLVGYGCTTCIGNSGPLPDHIAKAIKDNNLVAVSVLSGNRNFEGRINPHCRANYLASPPLVVAYALAGRMDFDIVNEPIGNDKSGKPVYLREIWPTPQEVESTVRSAVSSEMFKKEYADVFTGDEHWRALPVPEGDLYAWSDKSTYIKNPPYFEGMPVKPAAISDLRGLRALAVLGDSITTDHISPAGSIQADSPAGKYLIAHGVQPKDFNSYGARRGNHEVMMRGTFREHPPPQSARAWHRRRLDRPSARRRADDHLRRGDEVSRRRRAARNYRGERIRLRARRATGRRKELCFSAFAPCLRKASSASIAAIWSAWACCRWNSRQAKISNLWDSPASKFSISRAWARKVRAAKEDQSSRARRSRQREEFHRHRPRRYAVRGRLLPARRHPSIRFAPNALARGR